MDFVIPLTPVSKKNSQRFVKNKYTNRQYIIPSSKFSEYEKSAALYVPRMPKPIKDPVNVKCLFYMPTRRLCDLTNMLEAIDDVMVKCGLIEDDNYRVIQSHDGSRVLYDKENPRTEVFIEWTETSS